MAAHAIFSALSNFFFLLFLSLAPPATATFLGGVTPTSFESGSRLALKVNAITSIHTQLSIDYYSLPYCAPAGGGQLASENLGEFLTGNKIKNSPYELYMRENAYCKILCQKTLSSGGSRAIEEAVRESYHNHFLIDNLPAALLQVEENAGGDAGEPLVSASFAGGFPVGFFEQGIADRKPQVYIYNHLRIVVEYHPLGGSDDVQRVVGFFVEPISIKHSVQAGQSWDGKGDPPADLALSTCDPKVGVVAHPEFPQDAAKGSAVIFTYDVVFLESDVEWASRWDMYLDMDGPAKIHWLSIVNSLAIVLLLSSVVGIIMFRAVRLDIQKYNKIPLSEPAPDADDLDEKGWKLVHADVFRPPSFHPMLFCVLVGNGAQLTVTLFATIFVACLGFLSPARRGSLATMILVVYVLNGAVAGFLSARLYKSFRGRLWQRCTVLAATIVPGSAFLFFLFCNSWLAVYHGAAAVPFLQIVAVFALWCCVSVPLVFLGSYFGYKKDVISYPTATSAIPREVPPQKWFLDVWFVLLVSGSLPFAAAFVELFFILSSVWMERYYYVFGFAFVVCLILLLTCSLLAVLTCYASLVGEDYNWWWRSVVVGASTSLYVFGYASWWFQLLDPSSMAVTYILYFGYMGAICFALFLVTGFACFTACFFFTISIYKSIKVD